MSVRIRSAALLVGPVIALAGLILSLPPRPASAATAQIRFRDLGPSPATEYVGILLPGGEALDFTPHVGGWYAGVCARFITAFGADETANATFSISPSPVLQGDNTAVPNCFLLGLADAGRRFTITGSYGGVTATGTVTAKLFRAPGAYDAGTPIQQLLGIKFNQFAAQVQRWRATARVPAGLAASIQGHSGRTQSLLRIWWLYRVPVEIEGLGNDLAAAGAPPSLLQQLSRVAVDMHTAHVLTLSPWPPLAGSGVFFDPGPGVAPVPRWMPPVTLLSGSDFNFPAPATLVYWFGL